MSYSIESITESIGMTVRAILQIYMPVEYVILCLAKKALD